MMISHGLILESKKNVNVRPITQSTLISPWQRITHHRIPNGHSQALQRAFSLSIENIIIVQFKENICIYIFEINRSVKGGVLVNTKKIVLLTGPNVAYTPSRLC